jgi:hypothetical protein
MRTVVSPSGGSREFKRCGNPELLNKPKVFRNRFEKGLGKNLIFGKELCFHPRRSHRLPIEKAIFAKLQARVA